MARLAATDDAAPEEAGVGRRGASRTAAAATVGGVFALLLGVGLAHHEMWRDELQAWMLARVSASPAALLANLRYEGHPALWHLLLWPLAHATARPEAMQALHFVFAGLGVAAWLAWAPFPLPLRALFAVSYLPLFEYGVVSRNYALALPLLWAICWLWTREPRSWVALGACLAVLANTNPYAWMLAAALIATFAFESWRERARRAATPASQERAAALGRLPLGAALARPWLGSASARLGLGAALAILGLGLALWQMVPPPDALYAENVTRWSLPRLYRVLGTVMTGYLPLPDWRTLTPWNSALLYRLPAPLLAGFALAWVVVAWLLLDSRAARTLFALGTGGLLAFSYLRYIGWARHHGHYFLLFVACCWLATAQRDGEADPRRRLRFAALAGLLVVHVATAAWFYSAALRRPFSDAKAAAARLAAPPLAGLPAVGYPDPPLPALAAYRGAPLVSLGSGQPLPFVRWQRDGEPQLSVQEVCARLAVQARRAGGAIAFVAPPATLPTACPALVAQRVGSSSRRPLVPGERLETWRVSVRGNG